MISFNGRTHPGRRNHNEDCYAIDDQAGQLLLLKDGQCFIVECIGSSDRRLGAREFTQGYFSISIDKGWLINTTSPPFRLTT